MAKLIAKNKKAFFNYELDTVYEAGIVLVGTEVKSIISSNLDLSDAFVIEKDNELFVINMFVAKYEHGNIFNVEEKRKRKLLLHSREILAIKNRLKKENLTIMPIDVHLTRGKIKLNIALAKRKKNFEKRELIKKKDELRVLKNID